jgi:hypothetical protein
MHHAIPAALSLPSSHYYPRRIPPRHWSCIAASPYPHCSLTASLSYPWLLLHPITILGASILGATLSYPRTASLHNPSILSSSPSYPRNGRIPYSFNPSPLPLVSFLSLAHLYPTLTDSLHILSFSSSPLSPLRFPLCPLTVSTHFYPRRFPSLFVTQPPLTIRSCSLIA